MEAEKFIFIVAAGLFLTAERVQIYLIFKQKIDEILAADSVDQVFRPAKGYGLSFFTEDIVEENILFAKEKQVVVKSAQAFPAEFERETQRVLVGAIEVKDAHLLMAAVHRKHEIGAVHHDVVRFDQAARPVVQSAKGTLQRACRGEFVDFNVVLIEKEQFSGGTYHETDRPKGFHIRSEQIGFQGEEIDVLDHLEVGVELHQSSVHLIENEHALTVGDGDFAWEIEAFFADALAADDLNGVEVGHFEVLVNAVLFGLQQVNVAFLVDFQVRNADRNSHHRLARGLE